LSCGWIVAVPPVKRDTASLVIDEPSGSVFPRTRATVWTEPVGFVAHVYQVSFTLFWTSGSCRVAGCTRSRYSTSALLAAPVPVMRAAARPVRVLKNAAPPCSSSAVSPMPTKPPPSWT
jgi:hypothetical protein